MLNFSGFIVATAVHVMLKNQNADVEIVAVSAASSSHVTKYKRQRKGRARRCVDTALAEQCQSLI
jgi:deoxyxylulose-5-phosphate synthase